MSELAPAPTPPAPIPPSRRGACPAFQAPMETGDGLILRLVPANGALTPAQLRGLAAAARAFGNGMVEVTARGSLQVRGLKPETVAPLQEAVRALGITPRLGVPVDISPLSGLDPAERADARPLAARIAAAAEALAGQLGPKVSVVIDGGGAIRLDGRKADIRLVAAGDDAWSVSIGGGAAETLGAEAACARTLETLAAMAARGRGARATDLPAGEQDTRRPAVTAAHQPAGEERIGGTSHAEPDAASAPPLTCQPGPGVAGQGSDGSGSAIAGGGSAGGAIAGNGSVGNGIAGEGAPAPAAGRTRVAHDRPGASVTGNPVDDAPIDDAPIDDAPVDQHPADGPPSLPAPRSDTAAVPRAGLARNREGAGEGASAACREIGPPDDAEGGARIPPSPPVACDVAPARNGEGGGAACRQPGQPDAAEAIRSARLVGAGQGGGRPAATVVTTPAPTAGAPDGARGGARTPPSLPVPRDTPPPPLGAFTLRDGSMALGIGLPFGAGPAALVETIADLAATAGARDVRPAPDRVLLLTGLAPGAVADCSERAKALGLMIAAGDPRAAVAACPGAPACASAHFPARAVAADVAAILAPLLDGSVSVHLSACTKGCARPAASTLALVGVDGGIALVHEGRAAEARGPVLAADALPARLSALAAAAMAARARSPGTGGRDLLKRDLLRRLDLPALWAGPLEPDDQT